MSQTGEGVLENYKSQKLNEPTDEHNPTLKRIETFYHGEMEHHVPEYTKEPTFSAMKEPENKGHIITPENLILSFGKTEARHIALIGPAGSGKSTVMKRIVRDAILNIKPLREAPSFLSFYIFPMFFAELSRKFELIHFLNIRDLKTSKNISPCDLFIGKVFGRELTDNELHCGYHWMAKNSEKTLFLFDGLDQAPWSLTGPLKKMGFHDSSSTSNVVKNLLEGNLFPKSQIIISSREHAIVSLPMEIRPQLCVSLAGLTLDSIKQLFIAFLGEDGEAAWEKASHNSPALVPLFSIPVFLVFGAIVYKLHPETTLDTMTEIMVGILDSIVHSKHFSKEVSSVIHKLEKLSFEGTASKKVLFNVDDLAKFGLNRDKIFDLIIKIPKRNDLAQHILQGDMLFYYIHQSIQEIFSALHVINCDMKVYKCFVSETLHDPHWSVVRRFICGILLNKKILEKARKFVRIENIHERQELLKRCLAAHYQQVKTSVQKLELFGALYETNDADFIQSLISDIGLENQNLTLSGMYALSALMSRCEQLGMLRLVNCDLSKELLVILRDNVSHSNTKLFKIDISRNRNMGVDGFKVLGELACRCQLTELAMRDCDVKALEMQTFRDALVADPWHVMLPKLDISRNKNMGVGGFEALGVLVWRCQLEELVMRDCDVKALEMQTFRDALVAGPWHVMLCKLDISGNRNMGDDGLGALGEIVRRCHLKELVMRDCDINTMRIYTFGEALASTFMSRHMERLVLQILDLGQNSPNEHAVEDAVMRIVGDILRLW